MTRYNAIVSLLHTGFYIGGVGHSGTPFRITTYDIIIITCDFEHKCWVVSKLPNPTRINLRAAILWGGGGVGGMLPDPLSVYYPKTSPPSPPSKNSCTHEIPVLL